MSRIDELVRELCPDGVRFVPVSDVTVGGSTIKWADARDREFSYIDLSSVDRLTRQIGETATIDASNAPSRAQRIVRAGDVIFATTRPTQMRWAVVPPEYDGQIASTGYCVLRPNTSVVLTNFLAHLLGTDAFRQYIESNQVAGNYPSIPDSRIRAYRIPVPPLEVQREIVRVLDQFTQLEAELEAELEARRVQYAHFRNALLERSAPRELWKPLGAVGVFERGSPLQKKDLRESGIPAFHYGQVYTRYGAIATETFSYVSEDFARGKRKLNRGDVFIATTSENVEDLGKAVAWLGSEPAVAGSDAYIFRSQIDARFLAYFFASEHFQVQKSSHVTGTKVKRISATAMSRILVPVPNAAEQSRVSEIIGSFEMLVNDLKGGLPGEIAARRKQYEYYRDRLLTFKEAT